MDGACWMLRTVRRRTVDFAHRSTYGAPSQKPTARRHGARKAAHGRRSDGAPCVSVNAASPMARRW